MIRLNGGGDTSAPLRWDGDTFGARSEVAVCVFPSCLAILSPERVGKGGGLTLDGAAA